MILIMPFSYICLFSLNFGFNLMLKLKPSSYKHACEADMTLHTNSLRKTASLSIDADLLEEAKILGVNLSRAAETGIWNEVRQAKKADAWLRENKDALEEWNTYVAEHGLPLEKYRLF